MFRMRWALKEVNAGITAASGISEYITTVDEPIYDLLLERNEEDLEKKKAKMEVSERDNLLAKKGKDIRIMAVKRFSSRNK